MNAVVLEHVPVTELPAAWRAKLADAPGGLVTVRIAALALSHGLRLADALIGATALELRAALITANIKHFATIPTLGIDAFTP